MRSGGLDRLDSKLTTAELRPTESARSGRRKGAELQRSGVSNREGRDVDLVQVSDGARVVDGKTGRSLRPALNLNSNQAAPKR